MPHRRPRAGRRRGRVLAVIANRKVPVRWQTRPLGRAPRASVSDLWDFDAARSHRELVRHVAIAPVSFFTDDRKVALRRTERIGLPRKADRRHFNLCLQLARRSGSCEPEMFRGVLVLRGFPGNDKCAKAPNLPRGWLSPPFLSSHGIGYGSLPPFAVIGPCSRDVFTRGGAKSGIAANPPALIICLRAYVDREWTIRVLGLTSSTKMYCHRGRGRPCSRVCRWHSALGRLLADQPLASTFCGGNVCPATVVVLVSALRK